MYKEPKFDTMYDLIRDYRESYREWGHSLAKVKLGPALPHAGDSRASQPIEWSKLVLSVKGKKFARCEGAISKFMRELLRFIPVAPAQTAIKGRWNTVNVIAQLKKQRPPSESAADKSKDDKRRKRRKGKKAGKSGKGGDTVERDDTAGGDSSECSAAHTKDLSEEREGQRSSAVCKSRGSERSRSRSQSFSVPEDEGDTDAAHDSVLSPGGAEAPIARPTFLGV